MATSISWNNLILFKEERTEYIHYRPQGMAVPLGRLGLVINFGERLVNDGIHRVVNGLQNKH